MDTNTKERGDHPARGGGEEWYLLEVITTSINTSQSHWGLTQIHEFKLSALKTPKNRLKGTFFKFVWTQLWDVEDEKDLLSISILLSFHPNPHLSSLFWMQYQHTHNRPAGGDNASTFPARTPAAKPLPPAHNAMVSSLSPGL
jgi:hypothetical protein